MPIPESQLERWSNQGATTTAKNTHESIRTALERHEWSNGKPDIYLQGSYRNSTNIRGDSDVDVVVQLNSVFRHNLPDENKHKFGFVDSDYSWADFRQEVKTALVDRYGSENVQDGKKTLKLKTPNYLPADVVVAIQYRKYSSNPRSEADYIEGMTFYVPSESRWIVNFPKLHFANGTRKNADSNGWYKPTIRVFKNARSYLISKGAPQNLAPSYYLECLLYNVPIYNLGVSYQSTFLNTLRWLKEDANLTRFVSQNEQLALFGPLPEQWSEAEAHRLFEYMQILWDNWYE